MSGTRTDAGRCDACAALPGGFVCANCYSTLPESLRRGDANADADDEDAQDADGDAGPVDDLTDLDSGDRVLWGQRSVPATVVDTGFGSHVILDGPAGGTYRIQPDPHGGFRFGDRGGMVEDLRRVDPDGDSA